MKSYVTLKVKYHLTAVLRYYGSKLACEIVSESFDDIKHTERSTIKIKLFCYDTTYTLSTYVDITSSTANNRVIMLLVLDNHHCNFNLQLYKHLS